MALMTHVLERMETAQAPSINLPRGEDPIVVAGFPSLRKAAEILGVSAAALSRRPDLEYEPRGREKRVRPRAVLNLASYYRKRSLYEVASDLVDFAVEQEPRSVRF